MHHCCQNAPNDDVILGSQPLDTWQCKFPSRSLAFADPRGSTSLKTLGVKVGSDLPGSLNTQKIPHKILHKGQCVNVSCYVYNLHFPILANRKKQNMAVLSTPSKRPTVTTAPQPSSLTDSNAATASL